MSNHAYHISRWLEVHCRSVVTCKYPLCRSVYFVHILWLSFDLQPSASRVSNDVSVGIHIYAEECATLRSSQLLNKGSYWGFCTIRYWQETDKCRTCVWLNASVCPPSRGIEEIHSSFWVVLMLYCNPTANVWYEIDFQDPLTQNLDIHVSTSNGEWAHWWRLLASHVLQCKS